MQKKFIALTIITLSSFFSLASADLEAPQPNAGKVENGTWVPASSN
jgi:hypothetical protein